MLSFFGTNLVTSLIKRTNYQFPYFSTNCEKCEISNNEIKNMYLEDNSPLVFDNEQNPVILDIDFQKFSISIKSYLITVLEITTPPVQWSFFGKNKIEEQWTQINVSEVFVDICPEGVHQEYAAQCDETTTKEISFPYPIGPFRFIRYSVLKQRSSSMEPVDLGFMRLLRLDFSGSIWLSSLSIKKISQKPQLFTKFLFILMLQRSQQKRKNC